MAKRTKFGKGLMNLIYTVAVLHASKASKKI